MTRLEGPYSNNNNNNSNKNNNNNKNNNPSQNYSKMYGMEPRFNEIPVVSLSTQSTSVNVKYTSI